MVGKLGGIKYFRNMTQYNQWKSRNPNIKPPKVYVSNSIVEKKGIKV